MRASAIPQTGKLNLIISSTRTNSILALLLIFTMMTLTGITFLTVSSPIFPSLSFSPSAPSLLYSFRSWIIFWHRTDRPALLELLETQKVSLLTLSLFLHVYSPSPPSKIAFRSPMEWSSLETVWQQILMQYGCLLLNSTSSSVSLCIFSPPSLPSPLPSLLFLFYFFWF